MHYHANETTRAPAPHAGISAGLACLSKRYSFAVPIARAVPTLVRRRAGKRVVAYGAAGRATILLNFCGLGVNLIEYVLDMSPLRYGKYVPGVNVPILPPEQFHERPPDYAIMTAWNYEPEIVRKEQAFLSGGGRFIVPLPDVRIIGAV